MDMGFWEHLTSFNALIVFAGTALLGLACGVIGSFTVLRERALIGDCVAHASLPGICISFMIFHERSFPMLFAGAIAAGLLSAWCVSAIRRHTRIKEDTALALVLSSFFGLGIALSRHLQNQPSGTAPGLDSFILGKAATISSGDVAVIAAIAAVSIGLSCMLFKEFTLLCFDREFAQTQGYPVKSLDFILMALVCLCASAGLPAVGAVLIVALLIFPAVTARLWTNRVSLMIPLAGIFGVLAAVAGTFLSAVTPYELVEHGLPTGPLIVVSAAVLFIVSFIVAPLHGILWRTSGRIQRDSR
jgi:manganese/zinc/iron transport system permease protein